MKPTYTYVERTVKNRSLDDIFNNARVYLDVRGLAVCTDVLNMATDRLYTLEEANSILGRVIDDSLYYGGRWL